MYRTSAVILATIHFVITPMVLLLVAAIDGYNLYYTGQLQLITGMGAFLLILLIWLPRILIFKLAKLKRSKK